MGSKFVFFVPTHALVHSSDCSCKHGRRFSCGQEANGEQTDQAGEQVQLAHEGYIVATSEPERIPHKVKISFRRVVWNLAPAPEPEPFSLATQFMLHDG